MAYIIRVGKDQFIKRTCRFGYWHGSIVLTDNIREARAWTRERDAQGAARCAEYRATRSWAHDRDKVLLGGKEIAVEPEQWET